MDTAQCSSVRTNSGAKEKRVTIPGVGTAIQLANGEVQVSYSNGSQLWVDGRHHVRFQYPDGRIANYLDTDVIPRVIMEKLQHMPKVLRYLVPSPVMHKIQNLRWSTVYFLIKKNIFIHNVIYLSCNIFCTFHFSLPSCFMENKMLIVECQFFCWEIHNINFFKGYLFFVHFTYITITL